MATLSEQPALQSTQTEESKDGKRIRDVYAVTFTFGDSVKTWEAQVAPGVPRIGDRHPSDKSLGVVRISTSPRARDDSTPAFLVEVEYEPNQFGAGSGESGGVTGQSGNVPVFRRYGISRTVPVQFDIHGTAITNSAGDPFIPAIEQEEHYTGMQIAVRVPFDVWEKANTLSYRDTVNNRPLFGNVEGTCKMLAPDEGSEVVLIDGTEQAFMSVTLNWHIKTTWLHEVLDAGMFVGESNASPPNRFLISPGQGEVGGYTTSPIRVTTVTDKKRARDDFGEAYADPILLNGKGQALDNNTEPVILRWATYRLKDHNALLKALELPTTLRELIAIPKG